MPARRPVRVAVFVTTVAFAAVTLQAGAINSSLLFASKLVGPQTSTGGEPSIAISRDRWIYVSYPTVDGPFFFRSNDNGRTWSRGKTVDTSSGDSSVNVDSSGAVYEGNGSADFQADVYKSLDHGTTWTPNSPPGGDLGVTTPNNHPSDQPFAVDRPWTAAYIPPGKTTNQARVYLGYHDFGPSQMWVVTSKDGGRTYGSPVDVISSPDAQAASLCNTIPGGVKVVQSGPHAGRVYVAWLAADLASNVATGCNITMLTTFHTIWIAWSDDDGATWTDHLVYDAGFGHDGSTLFADLALDRRGDPYVAFGMNLTDEWDMFVTASFDNGTAWNGKADGSGAPYKVNADKGTHFFAAIAAADPGHVDVAWIGTSAVVPALPYGKPAPGGDPNAEWRVYTAQSHNLRSGHPTWNIATVTPRPIHKGDVCTLGLFCAVVPTADRTLLDFIGIALDAGGMAHVAYTISNQRGASPGIYVANQIGGPAA